MIVLLFANQPDDEMDELVIYLIQEFQSKNDQLLFLIFLKGTSVTEGTTNKKFLHALTFPRGRLFQHLFRSKLKKSGSTVA